jgi:hypothetical protein
MTPTYKRDHPLIGKTVRIENDRRPHLVVAVLELAPFGLFVNVKEHGPRVSFAIGTVREAGR